MGTHVQGKLEKKYSVDLTNAGVADLAIRTDCKIFASGGWDGRYQCAWANRLVVC